MKKNNKSEDKEKGEEQRRKDRLAVYRAWAKDEEREEVTRVNAQRAIESGLI